MGQQLVLKWGQEQVDGARQAVQATADSLRDLKKAAQRRRQVLIFPVQELRCCGVGPAVLFTDLELQAFWLYCEG